MMYELRVESNCWDWDVELVETSRTISTAFDAFGSKFIIHNS